MSILLQSGISSLEDCEAALREVSRLWRKMTFGENFESRTITMTIPATTVKEVANPFPNGIVPSEWIVVDRTGDGSITRSGTWGRELAFYNPSGSSITATVRLFR